MPGSEPGLLPGIRSPDDLKKLNFSQLNHLVNEIRTLIISTVNKNGGHLASNLGVVELTIALHLVFNSPHDKIVWDVGHQCYTHKILTGRYGEFSGLRKSGGISGFPKVLESLHDTFNTGHASTSISAALGILAAEKISSSGNRAIAVIGDGALTGGLAFEALSHAGQLNLPLIVVLNDNKMSISPNVGGISKHLSRLSMKSKYQFVRRSIDTFVKKIPLIGDFLFMVMQRLKNAVKAVFYSDNFFVGMGFEYVGPINGHNIPQLVRVIRDARDLNKPVVIHVNTQKGKGYSQAENDPGSYHAVHADTANGSAALGKDPVGSAGLCNAGFCSFTNVFSEAVLEAGKQEDKLVVITAAMEEGTGLAAFKKEFPGRFFDVGIAEEHAVTFAAGLAAGKLIPVTAIYSSFFQRAIDQVIHDVCLQKLPVIFALDRCGLVGEDGETHQGIYDISLLRSAPGLSILTPAGREEMLPMLLWAIKKASPVVIRYPKATCLQGDPSFSLPIEEGRGVWIKGGEDKDAERSELCIFFTGGLYSQVMDANAILESNGINADLYNLRFLKPIDEDYLSGILARYKAILLAEDGNISGAFGEYLVELSARRNCSCKIKLLGIGDNFDSLGTREELLKRNMLDGEGIAFAAGEILGKMVRA